MLHAVNAQHGFQRIGPTTITGFRINRLDDIHHVALVILWVW